MKLLGGKLYLHGGRFSFTSFSITPELMIFGRTAWHLSLSGALWHWHWRITIAPWGKE